MNDRIAEPAAQSRLGLTDDEIIEIVRDLRGRTDDPFAEVPRERPPAMRPRECVLRPWKFQPFTVGHSFSGSGAPLVEVNGQPVCDVETMRLEIERFLAAGWDRINVYAGVKMYADRPAANAGPAAPDR